MLLIPRFKVPLACFVALVLCGCGGGSIDLQVSADALSYSKKSVFTLSGADLLQATRVAISKCSGLALEPSSRSGERAVSCTVVGTGEVRVDLKDDADNVIYTRSFSVPEPQVLMTTTRGQITFQLNPTAAPITALNFMGYVNSGFYDGTLIHRVVSGFIAQGGWLNTTPEEQPGRGSPIVLESNKGLSNVRGSVAMARSTAANSATTQFYFNLQDNPGLDYVNAQQPGYAVFARVVEGLDVMDRIGSVRTGVRYGLNDFPLDDIVVQSVRQIR